MGGTLRSAAQPLHLTPRLCERLEPGTSPDRLTAVAGSALVGPATDLGEAADERVVDLGVPGCCHDHLSLARADTVLVLDGEHAEPGVTFLRAERSHDRFPCSIVFPAEVARPPEAVLGRGVATARMRRAPEPSRRRTPVQEHA